MKPILEIKVIVLEDNSITVDAPVSQISAPALIGLLEIAKGILLQQIPIEKQERSQIIPVSSAMADRILNTN
jgi:hypothetical protein